MLRYQWYIRGWRRDQGYSYTAEELLIRLKEDQHKPIIEWFAPPREIWRACRLYGFPEKQAQAIKRILMKRAPEVCSNMNLK